MRLFKTVTNSSIKHLCDFSEQSPIQSIFNSVHLQYISKFYELEKMAEQ
jgi:hypothetical protein